MYTYTAGATGLDAAMPPWVQEGGLQAWRERLRDPAIRERVEREMRTPTDAWENLLLAAGAPRTSCWSDFKSDALKPLTGKTLAQVAAMRGKSPEDTAIDLVHRGRQPRRHRLLPDVRGQRAPADRRCRG